MSKRQLAHWAEGPHHAPAVVLLHSIATHSALWAAQVPVWASSFRVIRVDLPGHGASEPPPRPQSFHEYAEQVRDVLDALQVRQAALVGLSLGGMVAQAFALAWPERVNALVLAHTSARTPPAVNELWAQRLALFEQQGIGAQVAATLERWFTRDFAAGAPQTMAWLAEQIRSTSPAGYISAVQAIRQLDHLDRLGEITVPTLVIAGAADSAVPPAAAQVIANKIAGARLLVLDDAAHIGNVQQPVRFTEAVGGFLAEALRTAAARP